MLKILKLTLALFVVLFFSTCRKECPCNDPQDPECPNYDPCFKWKKIDTKFLVFQGNNGFPVPTWCDNIPSCDTLTNPLLVLKAPINNVNECEYEWQVGTDTTIRNGKTVTVDFLDYLNQVGWEKHFVVNLTIKRPLDRCLENPNDTLVKTSRSVFFTKNYNTLIDYDEFKVKYKGYFTHDPIKEVVLEFFRKKTFRGIGTGSPFDSVLLITGYPFVDTLRYLGSCGDLEGCENFNFSRLKIAPPDCPHTGNVKYQEILFYDNRNIRLYREFVNSDKSVSKYEFIGKKN